MTLASEWAQLLHVLQLGVYTPSATGGNVFVGKLPDSPDLAIAVARYPGGESDSKLGEDSVQLQFRIRGPHTDYSAGEAKAQQVYDQLHGLANRTLPHGTWLSLCVGLQSGPIDIGTDKTHRPEWTVNMRAEVERTTQHRPV